MLMERKARRSKLVSLTPHPRCPHCAAMEAEAVRLIEANEWLKEVAVDALVRADKPAARWRQEKAMLLGTITRLQAAALERRQDDPPAAGGA